MGESGATFLNFFLFLFIPFLFGFVFRKFRIPAIIGYIVGGIVIGNVFPNLVSSDVITQFANFGIILLLFTVGLEVNFEKLVVLKKFIILGGLSQIVCTLAIVTLGTMLFGFTLIQSSLIGIAVVSSSTTLVAKIIQERGEESSFIGELAMGILMFQDLAFIPFIIIFTFFNSPSQSGQEILLNILKGTFEAAVILFSMYYFGKKIIPIVFNRVARSSRELLNLFIILFIFFVGYVTSLFQVPILVSMFVAGVLVSQTLEHHHIFSQVRPLRDLMAIVFFVYIGTHINLAHVIPLLPHILLFSLFLIGVKAIVLLFIFLYLKLNSRLAFSLAVFLFQVSESAFILLSIGYMNRLFTEEQYLLVITSVLITLVLSPILIERKEGIYMLIRTFFKKYIPGIDMFIQHGLDFHHTSLDEIQVRDHVVICGYGRIGAYLGRALMLANIPFIAVDYNFFTVEKAKKEGVNIIYGDPTDVDILDYVETEHAAVLVSVVPERYSQEAIILNAKKLNPNILVISRVHKQDHQQRMKDLGATLVVQPELEASLSIIKKIFFIKNIPRDDILAKLHHFKVELGLL